MINKHNKTVYRGGKWADTCERILVLVYTGAWLSFLDFRNVGVTCFHFKISGFGGLLFFLRLHQFSWKLVAALYLQHST